MSTGVAVLLALLVAAAMRESATGGASARGDVPGAPAGQGTVVLQYQPRRSEEALPVYRGLLESMPRETPFVVGVGSARHEAELRRKLGRKLGNDPRLRFVHVTRPLGPWVRDRYIPFSKDGKRFLYVPEGQFVHPMERGSNEVAALLLKSDPGLRAVSSSLNLEGGDVVLTPERVFIGRLTVQKHSRGDAVLEQRFKREAEALFGRPLFTVGRPGTPLPYDHIDMFLSAPGGGTGGTQLLLLGDPALAMRLLYPGRAPPAVLREDDLGRFLRKRQKDLIPCYEQLAQELRAAGFWVVRVPILHAEPVPNERRGSILNWNNALLDHGAKRAYLPHYGIPALEKRAYQVWRDQGFEVVPIDSRKAIVHGGSVRCLTTTIPAQGSTRP